MNESWKPMDAETEAKTRELIRVLILRTRVWAPVLQVRVDDVFMELTDTRLTAEQRSLVDAADFADFQALVESEVAKANA